MGLSSDLQKFVKDVFTNQWRTRNGVVVPDDTSVALSNDGVTMTATVLYADLSDSTALVDSHPHEFAAEIYKSYLHCAAKILRSANGTITAYDGDRVMAVFIGDNKNTSATRAALRINWAVSHVINPAIEKQYGQNAYKVRQVVGIDTGKLLVAKTGIRNANDLVWVGTPANHAAKLCALNNYDTLIIEDVYKRLHDSARFAANANMWTRMSWSKMGRVVYGSNYSWAPE